jgi:hypothetical protein
MFSTLCLFLNQTGLLNVLNQNEQRVLFAPSNEAFTTFSMNPNIHNASSAREVTELLLYHVTNQLDSPSCEKPDTETLSKFNPSTITTQCEAMGRQLPVPQTKPVGQLGSGNGFPVNTQPEFTFPEPPSGLFCCNGRVQPISEVLVPQEYVSVCNENKMLSFTIGKSNMKLTSFEELMMIMMIIKRPTKQPSF